MGWLSEVGLSPHCPPPPWGSISIGMKWAWLLYNINMYLQIIYIYMEVPEMGGSPNLPNLESPISGNSHVCMCVYVYIYIYIWLHYVDINIYIYTWNRCLLVVVCKPWRGYGHTCKRWMFSVYSSKLLHTHSRANGQLVTIDTTRTRATKELNDGHGYVFFCPGKHMYIMYQMESLPSSIKHALRNHGLAGDETRSSPFCWVGSQGLKRGTASSALKMLLTA